MFFDASKVLWFVFAPSHLLVWLSVTSVALLFLERPRAGRTLAAVSTALFLICGVFPLGIWVVRPLEDRYPRPVWPSHVDGVLILSGGLDPDVLASRHVPAREASEPRIVGGVELARRYPRAQIIFSGGSGRLWSDRRPETQVARYVFNQLGLTGSRVVFESRSRDTWENLQFSWRLAQPKPGQVWILATSAEHLPRAVEAAKAIHWNMVPWPTDYLTTPGRLGGFFQVPDNLSLLDSGVHEWVGLLAYRWRR